MLLSANDEAVIEASRAYGNLSRDAEVPKSMWGDPCMCLCATISQTGCVGCWQALAWVLAGIVAQVCELMASERIDETLVILLDHSNNEALTYAAGPSPSPLPSSMIAQPHCHRRL